ncbi:MAG: hypothetical protein ACW97P_12710 [Candidatus Hodarchaeales archaeon]|jgi:hypothetical protein
MTIPQEISNTDLKQLLHYMSRIKAFEKIFVIQKDSMTRMIWGLLLIAGGLLEFVIVQLLILAIDAGLVTHPLWGYLNNIPWILAIGSGLVIQLFSDRHITNIYSYETKKEGEDTGIFFLIRSFVLMALVLQVFAMIGLTMLIYPAITLIVGITAFILDNKQHLHLEFQEVITKRTYLITPISAGIAIIVMVGGIILSPAFFQFQGLIFGVSVGASRSISAFWNRQLINSYLTIEDDIK